MWARPDAPYPQRSAEIGGDAIAAVHGVHIEAAAQAHGGVEQHPAYGIDEIDAVALYEAVESRPDVSHIVEHVVYACSHGFGRNRVVAFCHRLQDGIVDFRVESRSEEHTSELQSLMRISYA